MAQLAFQPGFRVTDTNGDPISGAKLYFYDAGTTDDRTVYTESTLTTAHAQPVVCDSGGLAPAIYVPEGLYRVKGFTAEDVTISGLDRDNISGPIDTSALTTTEAKPITAVSSVTSTTTLTASAAGTVVNCNPGGGSFTVTLPAASVGNGKRITLRNIGETGTVTLSGGASTIDGASTFVLDRQRQTVTVISDGSDWHVDNGVKVIKPVTLTLTDAASISWDMRDGNDAAVEITADRTLAAPDNALAGMDSLLVVTQDGFGGHSIAFDPVFKFPNDVVPVIPQGAGERAAFAIKAISSSEFLIRLVWKTGRTQFGYFTEYDEGSKAANTLTTRPHGLGTYPAFTQVWLECITTDLNWPVGKRCMVGDSNTALDGNGATDYGVAMAVDTTDVEIIIAANGASFFDRTTRQFGAITLTSWKVIIRVYE